MTIGIGLVAIDDRPKGLIFERPPAGIDAVLHRGSVRLPARTYKKLRYGSFYFRDSPKSLGVARNNSIPDAPNIFPALISHTIEKGVLQVIHFGMGPAIAHMNHQARFEPLQGADHGSSWILPIPPSHGVPSQTFKWSGHNMLRFEHQRVTYRIRCRAKRMGNSAKSISIHTIGAHFGKQLCSCIPVS